MLVLGCGYPPLGNVSAPDASTDSLTDAAPPMEPICASIASVTPQFHVSACATPTLTLLDLSTSVSVDTDSGTSTLAGLSCAKVSNGNSKVCALVALTIIIEPAVVLSAHGSYSLALLAHSINIHGTIDVASHINGAVGASALLGGCIVGTLPRGAGGGRGGNFVDLGGQGGDDGTTVASGGRGGGSFVIDTLTGSCGGTRGGDGSAGGGADGGTTTGGAGGGAVWIVSDTGQLDIENGAVINASGASGVGGAAGHGGSGGGAGGLIVLQAPSIRLQPNAMIFANGGHGGGGSGANPTGTGFTVGAPGTDPTDPSSGGGGGTGGTDGTSLLVAPALGPGDGGPGYPASPMMRNGQAGGATGRGGGGGGGSPGAIFVVSSSDITGTNVSPLPVSLQ